MKEISTKERCGIKTRNIFDGMTSSESNPEHESARSFFLKSVQTRVAMLYIMARFLEDNPVTASNVYNRLHPKFGSKSSFVTFIALGRKKGYFMLKPCKKDGRKKYIIPSLAFTKHWFVFIARFEGVPVSTNMDWDKIYNTSCGCE
tara:strand:- start:193 stop:630 length:438 start_codon:yes stop_codon:yes gene_type:complete